MTRPSLLWRQSGGGGGESAERGDGDWAEDKPWAEVMYEVPMEGDGLAVTAAEIV